MLFWEGAHRFHETSKGVYDTKKVMNPCSKTWFAQEGYSRYYLHAVQELYFRYNKAVFLKH
jgi:hypothetical protein